MNDLSDIDECTIENGGCSEACINTNGSYTCTCTNGYQLGNDGKSCYSMYLPYSWLRVYVALEFYSNWFNCSFNKYY